jgi:hypothetical protein
MLPAMFLVTEADAAAIRAIFEQEGELSAAIRCAACSPGSPTTQRRGSAPGASRGGSRYQQRLVRSPRYVFVGAGLGRRSRDMGLVNGQAAGLPTLSKDAPYAPDPGRRPAAAICAGWVRFVQQQQPVPAGKQHNHHRAAGNDARPLLSGSLPRPRVTGDPSERALAAGRRRVGASRRTAEPGSAMRAAWWRQRYARIARTRDDITI